MNWSIWHRRDQCMALQSYSEVYSVCPINIGPDSLRLHVYFTPLKSVDLHPWASAISLIPGFLPKHVFLCILGEWDPQSNSAPDTQTTLPRICKEDCCYCILLFTLVLIDAQNHRKIGQRGTSRGPVDHPCVNHPREVFVKLALKKLQRQTFHCLSR